MRTARNIAIVAIVAVPVAFVPAGGDTAEAVQAALQLGFYGLLGVFGLRLYRQGRGFLDRMETAQRAYLYVGLGIIAMLIAADVSLLLIALAVALGAAILAIVVSSRESY